MDDQILKSVAEVEDFVRNFDFNSYDLVMTPTCHYCPSQSQLEGLSNGYHPSMRHVYYVLRPDVYNYLDFINSRRKLEIVFKLCIACKVEF